MCATTCPQAPSEQVLPRNLLPGGLCRINQVRTVAHKLVFLSAVGYDVLGQNECMSVWAPAVWGRITDWTDSSCEIGLPLTDCSLGRACEDHPMVQLLLNHVRTPGPLIGGDSQGDKGTRSTFSPSKGEYPSQTCLRSNTGVNGDKTQQTCTLRTKNQNRTILYNFPFSSRAVLELFFWCNCNREQYFLPSTQYDKERKRSFRIFIAAFGLTVDLRNYGWNMMIVAIGCRSTFGW